MLSITQSKPSLRQFVESKSRYLALIPAVVVSAASFAFIPFDAFSLNNLSSAHYAILTIGSIWWVIASGMAVTYPKSMPAWKESSFLRHGFGTSEAEIRDLI